MFYLKSSILIDIVIVEFLWMRKGKVQPTLWNKTQSIITALTKELHCESPCWPEAFYWSGAVSSFILCGKGMSSIALKCCGIWPWCHILKCTTCVYIILCMLQKTCDPNFPIYIYSGQLSSKANKKGGCTVPWYNDPALACLDHSRSLAKMTHSAHWKNESIIWLIHHDFLGGRWPKILPSGHECFWCRPVLWKEIYSAMQIP